MKGFCFCHTQVASKIGNMPRRRPEFEQALPAPKQLNLQSLAPGSPKTHRLWGGVQASSNSVAVRRRQKPIFEAICVYLVPLLEILQNELFEPLGRVLFYIEPAEEGLFPKPGKLSFCIMAGSFFKFIHEMLKIRLSLRSFQKI